MSDTILTEVRGSVAIATLNRPQALNALNTELLDTLAARLESWDRDAAIRCIIVAGSAKAFAAGADIKEMADKSYSQMVKENLFGAQCDRIARVRKPIIAAVAGFALGGGCELALLCDFIIASDDAQFGQPEIKLGILPGIGGSQRLTRAVGKSLAMDMVLTGRSINAAEAKAAGLVARVVAPADLLQTALEAAHTIAAYNAPAVKMAKQAVNQAFESSLAEGLRHERLLFQAAFATEGQKEGMNAFVAKRAPVFRNR